MRYEKYTLQVGCRKRYFFTEGHWGEAHMRYLRELVLPHSAMKTILEECLMAVNDAAQRIARCETVMADLLDSWRLNPRDRGPIGVGHS